MTACADPAATPQGGHLDEAAPQAYLESKADLPWESGALAAGWRDTMICAASLGDGVADGAERFAVGLWHLPGMLARLLGKIGREALRRSVDLIMAATDEEALARVRATNDADNRRLLELLTTIRRTIPELWLALDSGTDWFDDLSREERVQLICEVTGRVAFEVLVVIAGDKGLSKLMGMSRIQLVHGVQSRAMKFASVARLAQLSKRAVVDVGAKIAGTRRLRWADPGDVFGALGAASAYAAIVAGTTVSQGEPLPALGRYAGPGGSLELFVHDGEWESTPGYGYLDVILLADGEVPSGAIPAEGSLSYTEVSHILQILQPDSQRWGAGTLEVLDEGRVYQRYFVPADTRVESLVSDVSNAIESRFRFLEDVVGDDLRSAVETVADYSELTPTERVGYLEELISEADGAP